MVRHSVFFGAMTVAALAGGRMSGDEPRAPVPTFAAEEVDKVFFSNLAEIFPESIPTVSAIRADQQTKQKIAQQADQPEEKAAAQSVWPKLISAGSIEDEIKRVRLRFDRSLTTPGAFKGGGFQDARLDLTIMATLFAVVADYSSDIRWQKQAGAARDALSQTALRCSSGSTQAYNEAKLRKADLQDLVSGAGFSDRNASKKNDWETVADRVPLMIYAQELVDSMREVSRDAEAVKNNSANVMRHAELLAMLGEVLVQEGLDDAGDEDYDAYSRELSASSRTVAEALKRNDYETARSSAAKIESRCDACHADYR